MVKTMRGRDLAFFLVATVLAWDAWPSAAHASVYPIIDEVVVHDFAKISGSPDEARQSALKAGDTITLQVNVDSIYMPAPTVTVDLSALGLSNATTTTATGDGNPSPHQVPNDRTYYSNYSYDFGPFTISADVPDGAKDIPISAIDAAGSTVSYTAHITIDNVAPEISLSNLTFSTASPSSGDYMYLSGSMSGTGSRIVSGRITETLLDAEGNKMVGQWPWSYVVEYGAPDLIATTSSDGSFVRVPFQLSEGVPNEIAESESFKLRVQVFDAAGNTASTELVVPLRAQQTESFQASNVLFLPGIEGSRLYEGTGCGKSAEEKLWEPFEGLSGLARGVGDRKVHDLALTTAGTSVCSDIYAKEGDIIDSVNGTPIYASLISEMNGLKADGTINDWKPVAYDWRLSLDDLLTKGAQHEGRIYYEEATSTPYIEQTLRSLAASSKTGKVSIIAHSNGGLVTKALLKRLGSEASQSLVDKIIMVGVPQSGAPLSIGSTLVGYDAGIYQYGIPVVSNAAARSFSQNSPMTYHLLPSEEYFWSAGGDTEHPVVRFSGYAYANERLTYGSVIKDHMALDDFLLAKGDSRTKPKENDLKSLEILNAGLIDYANRTHSALDIWVPPPGIQVNQIAGWGIDTVGGIDFYTASSTLFNFLGKRREYRPIFIEDGDGTVPVPSALLMASSTNVKNYWLNLTGSKVKHANVFESADLEIFLKNIINGTSTRPSSIVQTSPRPSVSKKLTFILHAPVSFKVTDGGGSPTIPGLSYGEIGGVMYVTIPEGGTYQITIQGQESGLLDLDMQERTGSMITASSTIESIPITGSTLVNLTISGGLETTSPITVDANGDGKAITTIVPAAGQTVIFPESPAVGKAADDPPPPSVAGGGAGGPPSYASTPVLVSTTQATTSIPAILPPVVPVPETLLTAAASTTPLDTSTAEEVSSTAATIVSVPSRIRIAAQRAPKKALATVPKSAVLDLSQTASVYGAAHQPIFTKLLIVLTDGLHKFWVTIKRLL